jgi:hypothetical protein
LKRLLFGILILFASAGCNPAAKFSVVEAGMPTLNGLASLHGTATVLNSGGRDVVVESATIVVHNRDRDLGTARLLLPIEIPPGGAATAVRYDLALGGLSLASLQAMQSRAFTNPDAFTVDVKGYVRWGAVRKKIELDGVPLARLLEIISNFAV